MYLHMHTSHFNVLWGVMSQPTSWDPAPSSSSSSSPPAATFWETMPWCLLFTFIPILYVISGLKTVSCFPPSSSVLRRVTCPRAFYTTSSSDNHKILFSFLNPVLIFFFRSESSLAFDVVVFQPSDATLASLTALWVSFNQICFFVFLAHFCAIMM